MNVWKRMADKTRALLNDVQERASSPTTGQHMRLHDIDEQIDRKESESARCHQAAAKAKDRYEDALLVASKAQEQAEAAIKEQHADDAKLAVESRLYYELKAVEYSEQYTAAKLRADELMLQAQALKSARAELGFKRSASLFWADPSQAKLRTN
ncbi:PspA/IM30 family protein [Paenibacillus thalictri]|uniref:PspA/IM30 family protein n=1 Tax=Paenibacillus thalictri TaxID=2527873 RepID=A0A4Q9DC88_9BACL|nr:hypothetical protein [Paenibacillus thalictri]TBL67915.1 hypothetical protein EYB31_39190 [Paenibacillus thalictri]